MTAADYSWGNYPYGPIEAQVRAERDAALAELSEAHAALAAVEALVLHHEAHHGGLVPACQIRKAVGMGPRRRGVAV